MSSPQALPAVTHRERARTSPANQTSDLSSTEIPTLSSTSGLASTSTPASSSGPTVPSMRSSTELVRIKSDLLKGSHGSPVFTKPRHQAPVPPDVPQSSGPSTTLTEQTEPKDGEEDRAGHPQPGDQVETVVQPYNSMLSSTRNGLSSVMNEEGRRSLSNRGVTASTPDLGVLVRNSKGSVPSITSRRSFLQPSDEPNHTTRPASAAAAANSSSLSLSASITKSTRSLSDGRPGSRSAVSPQPDLARTRTMTSHRDSSRSPLPSNPRTKDPILTPSKQSGVGQIKANGGVEHLKTPQGAKSKMEGPDRESSPGRSFRSKAKNVFSRFFNSSPSGLSTGGSGNISSEPSLAKGQPIRTLPGPEERIQPKDEVLLDGNTSVKSFGSDSTDVFVSPRLSEASAITNGESFTTAVRSNPDGTRSSIDPATSGDQTEKERSFVVITGKKHIRTLSDPVTHPMASISQTVSHSSAGAVGQSNSDVIPSDTRSKKDENPAPLPTATITTSPESRSSTPTGDETIVHDGDLTFLPDDHSSDSLSRPISPSELIEKRRKASLSVGEMSEIGTWECDLEGLLDGIAKKGGQPSPLKSRHGGHPGGSFQSDSKKDRSGQTAPSPVKNLTESHHMISTDRPVLGPPMKPFVLSSTSQGDSSLKPAHQIIPSASEPNGEPRPGVEADSKSDRSPATSSRTVNLPRENLTSPSFSTTPSTPPPANLDVSATAHNSGRSISPASTTTNGGSTSSITKQRTQSANPLDVKQTIRLVPSSPSPVLPRLPHTDGLPGPDGIHSGQRGVHGLGLGVGDADDDGKEAKIERLRDTDDVDIREMLGSVHEFNHEDEEIQNEAGEAVDKILRRDPGFKWVQTNRVAEFLGGRGPVNVAAASLYMESFEFTGMKLDQAIRKLTSELYFKAETQELDRIIIAFCERYLECNPDTLFGSIDVLHQVAYSLLLLNTDLHVADQDRKMTRNQFVENTMSSIRTENPSLSQSKISLRSSSPEPPTTNGNASVNLGRDVFDDGSRSADLASSQSKISNRVPNGSQSMITTLPSTPEVRSNSPLDSTLPPTSQSMISTTTSFGSSASSPLVGASVGSASYDPRISKISRPSLGVSSPSSSVIGSMFSKSWSHEMESALKDLYNSVKSQEIIQPLNTPSESGRSFGTLSPASPEMMSRNQSIRSQSSSTSRLNSLKRGSIRGFTSLTGSLGSLGSPYSANSSSGRLSPTLSVATSMGEEYTDSTSQFNPSMGFASNLSHTIIKEHDVESVHSAASASTIGEILDEELALLGSPWAKEGLVTRKYYMDPAGKRSKDKAWRSLFAVVQKGSFKTFTFENPGNSSNDSTVGGGNWLANATIVDEFSLSHSIAKILPSPGYNRLRPFVFVIHLPSGAQTYFQVGTDTLTEEWVSTCNYWAARVSKEPLTGGVSNMDYGWGRPSFGGNLETESVLSMKRQSSLLSTGYGSHVNEWKPPSQPLYPSRHDEESQLEALKKYLVKLEEEIAEHKIAESFLLSPRHFQGGKAHDNYRRKKQFLKDEHIKYTTYITSLEAGLVARLSKKGELRLNHTLEKASR